MNAIRTIIAIVWLTGLLPGMVQASDADQFVAASRSQQAELLTQWATAPEAARLPLHRARQLAEAWDARYLPAAGTA